MLLILRTDGDAINLDNGSRFSTFIRDSKVYMKVVIEGHQYFIDNFDFEKLGRWNGTHNILFVEWYTLDEYFLKGPDNAY